MLSASSNVVLVGWPPGYLSDKIDKIRMWVSRAFFVASIGIPTLPPLLAAKEFALEKPFEKARTKEFERRSLREGVRVREAQSVPEICQQTARESARLGCSSQVHLGLAPSWMR